jgi:oligopeptide transport system substrate-binding protein
MPTASADPSVVFRMAITEPAAIDPYRAQEIEGIGITKQLFVGLVGVDRDHRLAPAVAESWECDDSGLTWTFRLRRDARFSNGEQVDAQSFVRGLNRALDPAAGTETGYHVAGVLGCQQVRSGRSDTLAGVRAADRWTLVFDLTAEDFEFDKKTLQPIFSPVPKVAGKALNREYNDRPIGNGPYLMAEPWQHGKSITLRRNPEWFGLPPAVDEVRIDILDPDTALDAEYLGFRRGSYDYARIPAELVVDARPRYLSCGSYLERDLPGLHYLIPFCHHGPMASVAARRAVSAAIDRAGIAQKLLGRSRQPASSLVSPWFSGVYTPGLGLPYTGFDPELARACAADAGLVPGSTVELAYNGGAGHDIWVRAIGQQLRRVLGLDVSMIRMSTPDLVVHRTSARAQGLCRAGWAYDYPTPDNLLYPLLHSECTVPDAGGAAHGDNEGRYANPKFDDAVARARATVEEDERAERWREAERIAMDDMALIPLWYRTEHRVYAADRFAGMELDFFGNPTITELRPRSGQAFRPIERAPW